MGPSSVFAADNGGDALDSNDFIVYDSKTATLYYDANGAGAKVAFALIDRSLTGLLDAQDFVVASTPY